MVNRKEPIPGFGGGGLMEKVLGVWIFFAGLEIGLIGGYFSSQYDFAQNQKAVQQGYVIPNSEISTEYSNNLKKERIILEKIMLKLMNKFENKNNLLRKINGKPVLSKYKIVPSKIDSIK